MGLAGLRTTPISFDHTEVNNQHTTVKCKRAGSYTGIADTTGRSTPPVAIMPENCGKLKETVKENCPADVVNSIEESQLKQIECAGNETKCKQKIPAETIDMLSLLSPCRHCLENQSKNKERFDWEGQQSPAQLLDQYLKFGKSLQERTINR